MSRASSLGYLHEHVASHRVAAATDGPATTGQEGAYAPTLRERALCCAMITALVSFALAMFGVVILRSPS